MKISIERVFKSLAYRNFFKLLPAKFFVKMMYKVCFNKKLDFNNPKTFNEKLQVMKFQNRKFSDYCDKIKVREIVKEKIGEEYLIPLLGVWDNPSDINFDDLPEKFALKCNHDSGSVVVCNNKKTFDQKGAVKKLKKYLKKNYYYVGRDSCYLDIKPKVLCEKHLHESREDKIVDYKFFCFNGRFEFLEVIIDRVGKPKANFYDRTFKKIPLVRSHPNFTESIKKPDNFNEMVKVVEELSKGFPHVRIDLYSVNNSIYFGEYTFTTGDGFGLFHPEKYDYEYGKLIRLR